MTTGHLSLVTTDQMQRPLKEAARVHSARLEGVRVALFSGAYDHIADGVSLTLNRLVAHLEGQGAHVRVFAPTVDRPALEAPGELDPVPSFPMPGRGEYRISLRLPSDQMARLESFQPDIVHLATPDLPGRQVLGWAKSRGIPVISTYHTHFTSYLSYYNLGWTERLVWQYLRRFYGRCDLTLVPSRSMADVLEEHGISEGVRIWRRGVELDRFHPDYRDLAWRRSLAISDEDVVVTLVSRLVLEKGLGVFADTVNQVSASGLRVKCLVVGEGPAREFLQEQLPEAVFLGHQTGEDLSRAYASSDVFVFPSYTETFGNVTLEAMASGLPAVCADATGSRSLVVSGRTGFLAPPENVDVFAAHVERLVTDSRLRAEMSAAARAEAARYAWPRVLDFAVGQYEELLRNSRSDELRLSLVD